VNESFHGEVEPILRDEIKCTEESVDVFEYRVGFSSLSVEILTKTNSATKEKVVNL